MGTAKCFIVLAVGIFTLILGILLLKAAKKRKKDCTETVVAEVYEITETETSDEDTSYTTYTHKIKYLVKDVEYTSKIDGLAKPLEIGTKVEIKVNPENPTEIYTGVDNAIISWACLISGIILIVVSLVQFWNAI